MKIVNPKVQIIHEENQLKRIEMCGRVCYKSERKITDDSAKTFVKKMINSGHTSVLEHARVIVPGDRANSLAYSYKDDNGREYPYAFEYRARFGLDDRGKYVYAMNCRDFCAIGGTPEELETLKNAYDYMTVRFTCDRAIANELVRHRVFSFSQESTRYVNYEKTGLAFIRPVPFEWAYLPVGKHDLPDSMADPRFQSWYFACEQAESNYLKLIREGCHPQEARLVLPLSVKTELIMTGTHEQWTEMLKLRMDIASHPQMRYLMKLLVSNADFPKDEIFVPNYEDIQEN